ncbi:hypothetical protein A3K79_03620 [Candidatus Bathyarchaeota archaeon RBG_13_46_16b]|nr:MAG: hypothetical protein A3K79_03620 [Candidatus Bathyarchaeota archaeon RBG_13_46_16b]
MNEMAQGTANSATRISSFLLLIIFITLALSTTALILAFNAFSSDPVISGWLILLGFVGVGISMYVLLQARRRVRRLSIAIAPVTTTIECKKCGFKSVREFQRGDYIFKEVEPCQKCNENMMITAIYREVKEGDKDHYRF